MSRQAWTKSQGDAHPGNSDSSGADTALEVDIAQVMAMPISVRLESIRLGGLPPVLTALKVLLLKGMAGNNANDVRISKDVWWRPHGCQEGLLEP